MIRRAEQRDIEQIVKIYEEILDQEETGERQIGWIRGVYPTEATALEALAKESLFVFDEDGIIIATAKIDQEQVPAYREASWESDAPDDEVMVLHTLVVSPGKAGKGTGTAFVRFYEDYALRHGCRYLRMDTNEINGRARRLYGKLGYREAGIVKCDFNGIEDVHLVCLEKKMIKEP